MHAFSLFQGLKEGEKHGFWMKYGIFQIKNWQKFLFELRKQLTFFALVFVCAWGCGQARLRPSSAHSTMAPKVAVPMPPSAKSPNFSV